MKIRLTTSSTAAFTLVEIMIAAAIGLPVAAGAVWFLFEATRTYYATSSASLNNFAQWGLASRLNIDTRTANGLAIYEEYDMTKVSPTLRRDTATPRGNFLVLSSSTYDPATKKSVFNHLTGYVYDSSKQTLSKFEYDVPDTYKSPTPAILETILSDNIDKFQFTEMARGVSALMSGGPFFYRAKNYASAAFRLVTGTTLHTTDNRVVEASFFVRS